ncbi:MAG: VCBS repeat-containing protein, partial [Planctomycetaceae bacterium]
SFLPQDHQKGRVVWLRRLPDGGFDPRVILDGVGRVADVEPADFDGDGDLDLVVAEFGWRKTGRILLLEQLPGTDGAPAFDRQVVDGRHGAIHVPVVDLNGDGRPDFIALVSQEHEIIEAFLNTGEMRFSRQTIFAGNDPAYGSTGIQAVDFDGDGDVDVLATNGDMFDTFYIKPYHGIRWLENVGEFPWKEHALAEMPGVHRALAGDLDGDGDLDIVATSLLPANIAGNQVRPDFNAVMWLEQTEPGKFEAHGLLKAHGRFLALELGDFDDDGDLDFAIGGMREEDHTPALAVFWNERITNSQPGRGP